MTPTSKKSFTDRNVFFKVKIKDLFSELHNERFSCLHVILPIIIALFHSQNMS